MPRIDRVKLSLIPWKADMNISGTTKNIRTMHNSGQKNTASKNYPRVSWEKKGSGTLSIGECPSKNWALYPFKGQDKYFWNHQKYKDFAYSRIRSMMLGPQCLPCYNSSEFWVYSQEAQILCQSNFQTRTRGKSHEINFEIINDKGVT